MTEKPQPTASGSAPGGSVSRDTQSAGAKPQRRFGLLRRRSVPAATETGTSAVAAPAAADDKTPAPADDKTPIPADDKTPIPADDKTPAPADEKSPVAAAKPEGTPLPASTQATTPIPAAQGKPKSAPAAKQETTPVPAVREKATPLPTADEPAAAPRMSSSLRPTSTEGVAPRQRGKLPTTRPPGAPPDPWTAFATTPEQEPGLVRRGLRAVRRSLVHEFALAVYAGCLVAVAMTWPTLRYPMHTLPQDLGDPARQAWQLSWAGHILRTDPEQLWQSNAYFPVQHSFAFGDNLLGYALAGMIGNGPGAAILRYNVLFVLAHALLAIGAYALVRQLGARRTGAALAAIAFTCAPWRLAQEGHLDIISAGGIPLALAMLARGHGYSLRHGFRPERRRIGWVAAGWLVATWQLSLGFSLGIPFAYVLGLLLIVLVVTALVRLVRRAPWRASSPEAAAAPVLGPPGPEAVAGSPGPAPVLGAPNGPGDPAAPSTGVLGGPSSSDPPSTLGSSPGVAGRSPAVLGEPMTTAPSGPMKSMSTEPTAAGEPTKSIPTGPGVLGGPAKPTPTGPTGPAKPTPTGEIRPAKPTTDTAVEPPLDLSRTDVLESPRKERRVRRTPARQKSEPARQKQVRGFGWWLIVTNILGAQIFIGTGLLIAIPYVLRAKDTGSRLEEIKFFSPPLRSLLIGPAESRIWGAAHAAPRESLSWAAEMSLLPGFVLYALALAGVFLSVWRLRHRLALLAGLAVAVVLTLGTNFFGGRWTYLPLFGHLPAAFDLRVPGRLMLWVTLLLAILAAGAADDFVRRAEQFAVVRIPPWPGPWLRLATLIPLILVALEGWNTTAHPVVPAQPAAMRTVPGPMLVLPTAELTDQTIQLWTTSKFQQVANGGGSFAAQRQNELRARVVTFPDAASIDYLISIGVTKVLLLREPAVGTPWEGAGDRPVDSLNIRREDVPDAVVFSLNQNSAS